MPRRPPLALGRIIALMAPLSPPCHRELVRGMAAELDSIPHRGDRARFALGAVAAIARLSVSGYARGAVRALGRFLGLLEPGDGTNLGGPAMSKISTRQLMRRHVTPFAVSFVSLTLLLLTNNAVRLIPELGERGLSTGTILKVLLLTVPHIIALTTPMAVFLAVSWVFARLGTEGVLTSAKRERHGLRRLVAPVLGAAAVIAALSFVSNAQAVPRANARLMEVFTGAPSELTDRTMTIGQLREAAREARAEPGARAATLAARFEVEIQKKFAIPTACLLLALVGAAAAIRFPHGGSRLVLGASLFVLPGYFLLLAGESLADRRMVSPFVGMWMANAFLLAVALLLSVSRGRDGSGPELETLAIDG